MLGGFLLSFLCIANLLVHAQPSPEELAPLWDTLAAGTDASYPDLHSRVPLSTNDNTSAPLIDLQVYAPPVVPKAGSKCVVTLLEHDFGDGSYETPAVVAYKPPTQPSCGPVGDWAAVSLNLTVYSIGTQYDRLSSLYLSHVEIWRHSSAEPTKTGTIWTVKDVTHYAPLFAQSGDLMMEFSNIISADLLLDGVFEVTLTATFHAEVPEFSRVPTADIILPLSNLSPNHKNFFTLDGDIGGTTNITLPRTTQQAFIEVYASGNSAEEFWYLNTPDEALPLFPDPSVLAGKGPFREVQVLVDDRLAGVVWPHAVIYTGGITPTNWRPLTAYGAYDQPTYFIDATPFLPVLADGKAHNVTLRVQGQGAVPPSINSNWFVSGAMHLRLGKQAVSGKMTKYEVTPSAGIVTRFGAYGPGKETVWATVVANRSIVIESELYGDEGKKVVRFEQKLSYSNVQKYADEGWVQWGTQNTQGTTLSTYGGEPVMRDAFEYPLSVFSNYSLYTAQYGGYDSAINQTFIRAYQPPVSRARTVLSVQHARGAVGMDDWPGLRHAINGSGATDQQFAYTDTTGASYFRALAAANDGWVRDAAWGTLRDANPPVPRSQLCPSGGPGFRRMLGRGHR